MSEDKPLSELPRALMAAWGAEAPPRPGPRPSLSIGDLAKAGVELADELGLEAVTMAKVADRLGFTPMSLYRYVGSKDELIQLMFDEMGRDLGVSAERADGWRDGLESLAHALADRYAEHPWAVDVPIAGVPTMPSQVAVMEVGLELLVPEGLEPGEALGVLQLVAGFVRSHAALVRDITHAATPGAALSPFSTAASRLADLVDPAVMPRVAEAARSGLLSPSAPDSAAADEELDDLRFGLDRILDGVEMFIEHRQAGQV